MGLLCEIVLKIFWYLQVHWMLSALQTQTLQKLSIQFAFTNKTLLPKQFPAEALIWSHTFSWHTCDFLQMKPMYHMSISVRALGERFQNHPSAWEGGEKYNFHKLTTALCLLVSTKCVERTKSSPIHLKT